MSDLDETEIACLRAAGKPGGYVMYAAVQRDAAMRLKRRGLVVIEPGPTKFGTVRLASLTTNPL